MITIRLFRQDVFEIVPLDRLTEIDLGQLPEGAMVWVDMDTPTSEEETAVLRKWFPVHELVLADMHRAFRKSDDDRLHHPKVEDFGTYLYVIMHALQPRDQEDADDDPTAYRYASTAQVNIIIGENALITHHAVSLEPIKALGESCNINHRLMRRGPDFLLHLLLDDLVNQYLPLVTMFEDRIEEVEHTVFRQPTTLTLSRILNMKRRLQEARRTVVYQREIVNRLARGEFDLVALDESVYYRNVYDHLVRVADQLEAARDGVTSVMEAYFSVSNARLNQVMKVLTVISTIFLPLTFICSIYGMNFHFMPELDWEYGYGLIWAIILVIGVSMVIYFKRRGWLD